MSKYTIIVEENATLSTPSGLEAKTTTEIARLPLDTFDLRTFVNALCAPKQGRPAKAKKEATT